MSFPEDKQQLFEKIGTYKTLGELPKFKKPNSLDSVSSKSRNLLPFMMDLLDSLSDKKAGAQKKIDGGLSKLNGLNDGSVINKITPSTENKTGAKLILTEIIIEFLPKLVQILKEGVVKAIKAGLVCGTDFTIPNPTPSTTTTLDKLDFTGLLKMDVNGPASVLFGDINTDLNMFLHNIVNTKSSGTWNAVNGTPLLDFTYNVGSNNQPTITIKISDVRAGTSFHSFLIDYVNSTEFMSSKTLMANITEYTFGTIGTLNNIGVDTMVSLLQMDTSVDKILDVDTCSDDVIIDDSFFQFDNDELSRLESEARNKVRGVTVMDLGCGLVEIAIPISLVDGLKSIDGITPKKVTETINLTLDSMNDSVSQFGSPEDVNTMKLNMNLNNIFSLPKVLIRMLITPKIVMLYQVSNLTINGTILNVNNGYDFSKVTKTFFEYIVRESLAALYQILFNKIKREIVNLVSSVVLRIVKEKINLFIGSVTSVYLTKVDGIKEKLNNVNTETPI
jgi:hypothetical protein